MKERDWNPKHHPKIIIGGICLLIGTIILAIALHETPNPLIGKWRPQGKNVFPPTGDIEFSKDKVQMMGMTTTIKYDINPSKINLIDPNTETTIVFNIKDAKTIENTIFGVKTTYKKVEK